MSVSLMLNPFVMGQFIVADFQWLNNSARDSKCRSSQDCVTNLHLAHGQGDCLARGTVTAAPGNDGQPAAVGRIWRGRRSRHCQLFPSLSRCRGFCLLRDWPPAPGAPASRHLGARTSLSGPPSPPAPQVLPAQLSSARCHPTHWAEWPLSEGLWCEQVLGDPPWAGLSEPVSSTKLLIWGVGSRHRPSLPEASLPLPVCS